jgi:mannosyltransferase
VSTQRYYWRKGDPYVIVDGVIKPKYEITREEDLSPSTDPLLSETNVEPDPPLRRLDDPGKVNATLISLVRNQEVDALFKSILSVEATFNHKFHYPWTFFNDNDFTSDFKTKVLRATGGRSTFVKLDPHDWNIPEWIDEGSAKQKMAELEAAGTQYASKMSYHNMCRWYSGPFFTNPSIANYTYYWRVEPGTEYFCDIDYDVFAWMEEHDKDYGFTINLYDDPKTIRTLWNATRNFLDENPSFVSTNNAMQWLLQESRSDHNALTGGYSTCHFWSNFEIGSLDFFRSERYQKYFQHLDKLGGFYYERWGDAPVHSVALAMMTDRSRIHWFKDIGYFHFPYYNCPNSAKCKGCEPGKFTGIDSINGENCLPQWFKAAGAG